MFSKRATDKLREVFDVLFKTAPGKGDDARRNKLSPRDVGANDANMKNTDPTKIGPKSAEGVRLIRNRIECKARQIAA